MAQPAPVKRPRFRLLIELGWVAAAAGLLVSLVALVWRDSLGGASDLMLAAHYLAFMCQVFAYHAGLAMLPVIVLAIWRKRWRLLGVAFVAFLLGAGPDLLTLTRGLVSHAHTGPTLNVMSVNLMYGRGDAAALLAQIQREDPDMLVFQEWTPEGSALLREKLAATFSNSLEKPQNDAFGQAVFTKRPFVEGPRAYPPVNGFSEPQICFGIDVGGRTMRITDVHLLPPVNLAYFREQRAMAGRMAAWLADSSRDDRSDVLVGDFNSTPRTGTLGALYGAGLHDAHWAAGWWRGATWPRVGLLAWMPGIRLDHVLIAERVVCVEARTGEDFGSDHRPVIVRLGWAPSARP